MHWASIWAERVLRQVCMALRALNWLGSNWSWYWARNSDSKHVMTLAKVIAGADRVRLGDAGDGVGIVGMGAGIGANANGDAGACCAVI